MSMKLYEMSMKLNEISVELLSPYNDYLYEMSMKLNEISVELLSPYNDYLNDSNFLSLFFELSTGYEAIMVIICRKNMSC